SSACPRRTCAWAIASPTSTDIGSANNSAPSMGSLKSKRNPIPSEIAATGASATDVPGRWVNPTKTNGSGNTARNGETAPAGATTPQASNASAAAGNTRCTDVGQRSQGRKSPTTPTAVATQPAAIPTVAPSSRDAHRHTATASRPPTRNTVA